MVIFEFFFALCENQLFLTKPAKFKKSTKRSHAFLNLPSRKW